MDKRFREYVSQTITFETGGDKSGAFHSDPDDKGKETKWGISKNAFPSLNIKALTYKDAVELYQTHYYSPFYTAITSSRIVFKLFDMSVLMGRKTASKLLQKAIKAQSNIPLRIDGAIGPMTLTALNVAITLKGLEPDIYYDFISRIGKRLTLLSLKPGNSKFYKGWIKRAEYEWKDSTTGNAWIEESTNTINNKQRKSIRT